MKRLLTAVLGIALGLAGVELALRARALREYGRLAAASYAGSVAQPGGERWIRYDPDLGWSPQPGAIAEKEGVVISEQGFRGARVFAPDKAAKRIVFLGDSFTFGAEAKDEDAFPAVVGRETGWEAVNLGVEGYGIDQALLRYERDGAPLRADAVVLTVIPDDLHRAGLSVWGNGYGKPRFALERGRLALFNVPAPPRTPPGTAIEAVPLSRREALRVLLGLHPLSPGALLAAGRTILGNDEFGPLHEALLRRLREDCRESGAVLVVAVVPTAEELIQGAPAREKLAAFCRAEGIPYVDLWEDFRRGGDALEVVSHHPTRAGYRVIARKIEAALRAQLLGSPR